jgi:ubiquinone/menaquinone biosynthesis C-methylase UbiE
MKTEMRHPNLETHERSSLSFSNLMPRLFMVLAAAVLLGLSGLQPVNRCAGQDAPGAKAQTEDTGSTPETKRIDRPRPVEESRNSYLGRVLAKPMSHLGAPWLIRPEREEEERASESFKQLKLAEGMNVCDLGCGNGYWTLPMARDVGKDGKVYAVDIQREMLQKLRERSSKYKLNNIEPVLGKVDDPNLPANKVDLVLMVDVYHEFSHPESMLWGIRRSLNSKGVVALLEYREEDPGVPIKPLHKMSKRQIMKEYRANGFKLVREYNKLPWQHLMFFARDDSPLEQIEPVPAQQVLKNLE